MPVDALFEGKQEFILVGILVSMTMTTAVATVAVERHASTTNTAASATITTTSHGQHPRLDDGVLPFTLPHGGGERRSGIRYALDEHKILSSAGPDADATSKNFGKQEQKGELRAATFPAIFAGTT